MTRKTTPANRVPANVLPEPIPKQPPDQGNQLTTCDCCGVAKDPATMAWLENEPLFCCQECRAEKTACGCSDDE